MEEIANTVTSSSHSGHNIPQLVDDPEKPVIFFNWRGYLKQFFKTLKNLTTFHHFLLTAVNQVLFHARLIQSQSLYNLIC